MSGQQEVQGAERHRMSVVFDEGATTSCAGFTQE